MARILIAEPDDHAGRVLEHMIVHLGHVPMPTSVLAPGQLHGADLLLVEPATSTGALLALAAYLVDPALPIVCAGLDALHPGIAEFGIEFASVLAKPFTVEQLREAIDQALRG